MISIHLPPRQNFAERCIQIAACQIGHGEARDYAALSGPAVSAGNLDPSDKANAAFRDLEGPAGNEQTGAWNRFLDWNLSGVLAKDAIP